MHPSYPSNPRFHHGAPDNTVINLHITAIQNRQAWIPPASPTALAAECQKASPTPSHPGPRGSQAARRRQSLAPHRKSGGLVTRVYGNWKSKGGGSGGGGGGSAIMQAASSSEGGARPGVRRRGHASAGVVDGCNDDSHPRSQEQRASRDEEISSRVGRTNVSQRSSNSGGGSGGARGIAGGGEAWGAATTVTPAARTSSDRMHSSGAGCGRAGKSSNRPEVWAWAGTGGGAARGKAMLSAYELQTDKHNPTCPRGTPGESVARHGRWQRSQDGSGARKVESGGGAAKESSGESCRGSASGVGNGERRSSARETSNGRAGDKASDRVSVGRGHRFRGSKGRKHRSSAAVLQDRSRPIRDRCRSEDREAGRGQLAGDSAAEGYDGGGRGVGPTSMSIASTSGGHREEEGVVVKPGSRELSSQDILVLSRGATASPHPSGCSHLPTTTASGQHAAILPMDGRGGSAAPPHRPSLAAATSPPYAPVLPDLTAVIGTGAAGGIGVTAAFESDNVCGDGDGGGGGGDDHSTPPVSRQRSHSHHSPWQARKHPRGFFGGRAGRHHHTSHHQGHPHERSRVEERPRSGSATGRIGACFSPESTEMAAATVISASACAAGAWVMGGPAECILSDGEEAGR